MLISLIYVALMQLSGFFTVSFAVLVLQKINKLAMMNLPKELLMLCYIKLKHNSSADKDWTAPRGAVLLLN